MRHLMTTTRSEVSDGSQEIIDCYVEHGFQEIFLRPLSPYGFAVRTSKSHAAYDARGPLDVVL